MSTKSSSFVSRLQAEAAVQSRLHRQRLLPSQLDRVTSFVGNYPWQVLFVLSGLTAVLIEVLTAIHE